MPYYTYTNEETGESVRRFAHMDNIPKRIRCNGRTYVRDIPAEWRTGKHRPGQAWPMVSTSGGVNPAQIAEAKEKLKQAGVPTEFTKDGDVIHPDRTHRKRYHEAMGFVDKSGGYGDCTQRREAGEIPPTGEA